MTDSLEQFLRENTSLFDGSAFVLKTCVDVSGRLKAKFIPLDETVGMVFLVEGDKMTRCDLIASRVCETCHTSFPEDLPECKACHARVCDECNESALETGYVCSICNQKGCTE